MSRLDKHYIDDRRQFQNALLLLKDISEIENEETALILDRLTYAIFGIALMPKNEVSITTLECLAKLYLQVKEIHGDWIFYPDVKDIINKTYDMVKQVLPLKVGIKKASSILRKQLINVPFRNGIELGVISEIIDLKNTPYLKEDLPSYSRLGLGYHSDKVVNEEWQLLSDAFYLLVMAKEQYEKMCEYKDKLPGIKTENHLLELTNINSNVCTYCRTSVVSFYAFFEAFINGIGLNYLYYHHSSLTPEDIFMLQGKDKTGNRYLKSETKIESLQRIIAKKVKYKTNNSQQLKDQTFISLFKKMQEKRDVAMHYSKIKGEIMFSPQEWMDEAFEVSKLVVEASRKLWEACYPQFGHYPYYLKELNYKYLLDRTKERIIG